MVILTSINDQTLVVMDRQKRSQMMKSLYCHLITSYRNVSPHLTQPGVNVLNVPGI